MSKGKAILVEERELVVGSYYLEAQRRDRSRQRVLKVIGDDSIGVNFLAFDPDRQRVQEVYLSTEAATSTEQANLRMTDTFVAIGNVGKMLTFQEVEAYVSSCGCKSVDGVSNFLE